MAAGAYAAAAVVVVLSLQATGVRAQTPQLTLSGTVSIVQDRVSLLISINRGSGILHFQGKDRPFSIGGIGVGGVGGSKLVATGNVYNLPSEAQFPGLYREFRTGYAIGDKGSGRLWLKNGDGVVLELVGKGEGVALSLGADAIKISY
jgi:hypothetical protein